MDTNRKKNFVKKFWMENINFYFDIFEWNKVRIDTIYSRQLQNHLTQ